MRLKLLREYFNLIEKNLVANKGKNEYPISLLKSIFLPFSGVLKQRSHVVPGHGARARYSVGTNVNTPFFQAPTLVHGYCASAPLQGRELALGHKSEHRVPVYTVFVRSEAIHSFVRR